MNIPILMYHQIDQAPPRGKPLRGLVVSPPAFARQMGLLRLLGYKGLSMRELEPYLSGSQQGKVVGLTFDDGYRNNLQHALPVLQKNRFTATCYGVSNRIGGVNEWDLGIGVDQKPLMTAPEWRQWLGAGMEVGSHTRNHADLSQLDHAHAMQEIAQSRQELEQQLGCEVRHFCYPYGRFATGHPQLVASAGYATATTTQRGRVKAGADLFRLRRIMIARSTSLVQFALKVLTAYEDKRG